MPRARVPLTIKNPAQNTTFIGASGGRFSQSPVSLPQNPIASNPMFGRPIWTYTRVQPGPVRGPQPRLARGSGRTGDPALPGNSSQYPGYLSDNEYLPTLFPYDPVNQPTFQKKIPRTIGTGDDGEVVLGTYRAHDFTPGQRFLGHTRQAANWQVMEYPPDFRNLLAYQQVARYRVMSYTLQARPLQANDYFLGYQVNPQIQAMIGQTNLGYMGSM